MEFSISPFGSWYCLLAPGERRGIEDDHIEPFLPRVEFPQVPKDIRRHKCDRLNSIQLGIPFRPLYLIP